jgi:hypothetical protein
VEAGDLILERFVRLRNFDLDDTDRFRETFDLFLALVIPRFQIYHSLLQFVYEDIVLTALGGAASSKTRT